MVYKTVQSVQKIVRIGCKAILCCNIFEVLTTCRDNVILSFDSSDTYQRNVALGSRTKKSNKKIDNQKHIYVIFRLVSISFMESKE